MAELEAALDAKARRVARSRVLEEAAGAERCAALNKLIGDMVKTLIAAERAGKLASAAPEIARIGKALNVKPLR